MDHCQVCNAPATLICQKCGKVGYCNRLHQLTDWSCHKEDCFPFTIEVSEELGRHWVATRDIQPFERILREPELVRFPMIPTRPVCLGCLCPLTRENHVDCHNCGWPMCSTWCMDSPEHKAECRLTRQNLGRVSIIDFEEKNQLYDAIGILRCLMLEPEKAAQFNQLETLYGREHENPDVLKFLEKCIDMIPNFFRTNRFSREQIMRAAGIVKYNAHPVTHFKHKYVTVYYKTSFIQHACVPNMARTFTSEGKIILWTPKQIKKGEHMTICYTSSIWTTEQRQAKLLSKRLFTCKCDRCEDMTELGSHLSTFLCQNDYERCEGDVLPNIPNDWKGDYICNPCGHTRDSFLIESFKRHAKDTIKQLESEKCLKKHIIQLEMFREHLHPQHHYINWLKHEIVMRVIINEDTASDRDLQFKRDFADDLIYLYEFIAPCETRLLGHLYYEKHATIHEQNGRICDKTGTVPKQDLLDDLEAGEKCIEYWKFESPNSEEAKIRKEVTENLEQLREEINHAYPSVKSQ